MARCGAKKIFAPYIYLFLQDFQFLTVEDELK